MAYAMPDGPLVRESTRPAPTSTNAMSSRRATGFVAIFSARLLKIGVV
jgi:hypothetical protein